MSHDLGSEGATHTAMISNVTMLLSEGVILVTEWIRFVLVT